MTSSLSGVVMLAAFGLVAAAGMILSVALCRISGRRGAGSDGDRDRADPEGG
jgi:predicted exporter